MNMKNISKNRGASIIEILVVIAIIGIICAIVFGHSAKAHACGWLSSCGPSTPSATELQQTEQEKVSANQSKMETSTPIPMLQNSLERANISKRLTTWQDPTKVSYIYLTSYGHIMAFYTVKGKVTSGTKRLTSTERKIGINCGQYCDEILAESPELDGTYGSSAPYIFFWTTDGTYVQWNGEYMLSDNPLQLNETPAMVRSVK